MLMLPDFNPAVTRNTERFNFLKGHTMSGEKHVRLRESEYWHLMNSANQVRDLQRNNANVERELRKAQTAIEQQRRSAQDRERAFSRQVDTLSDELRASAREFQQKLHTQQQAFSRLEARQDRRKMAGAKHCAMAAITRSYRTSRATVTRSSPLWSPRRGLTAKRAIACGLPTLRRTTTIPVSPQSRPDS